jgi:pimeloyl-ACP methyl ester carboxylesterase
MKNRLLLSSFIVLAMMLVLSPFTRAEVPPLPPECKQQPLAVNDPQTPEEDFQLVLICVPENWNRSLVIYAHGFVPPQPQFPLVLPINELTIDNTFLPQLLLAQGFAFTTSSYHKNGAVTQQAIGDLLDLLNFFQGSVGLPSHVFIIGGSEGGLTAIQLLEQHPDQFAGGLALCASCRWSATSNQIPGRLPSSIRLFFPGRFLIWRF